MFVDERSTYGDLYRSRFVFSRLTLLTNFFRLQRLRGQSHTEPKNGIHTRKKRRVYVSNGLIVWFCVSRCRRRFDERDRNAQRRRRHRERLAFSCYYFITSSDDGSVTDRTGCSFYFCHFVAVYWASGRSGVGSVTCESFRWREGCVAVCNVRVGFQFEMSIINKYWITF